MHPKLRGILKCQNHVYDGHIPVHPSKQKYQIKQKSMKTSLEQKSRSITVIGSDGYLANEIILSLERENFNIYRVNRSNNPWMESRLHTEVCERALGCDLIVNLAQIDMNIRSVHEQYHVNVVLNRNIMEYLTKKNYKGQYLYLSSANISTRALQKEEASNWYKETALTEWQLQKRFSEHLVEHFRYQSGLSAHYLRVPNLFGLTPGTYRGTGNSALNRIISDAILLKKVVLFKNADVKRFFLHIARVTDFIKRNYLETKPEVNAPAGITLLSSIPVSYRSTVDLLGSAYNDFELMIDESKPLSLLEMQEDRMPSHGVKLVCMSEKELSDDIAATAEIIYSQRMILNTALN